MKFVLTISFTLFGLGLFGQVNFGYDQSLISLETKQIISTFNNASQVEGKNIYYGGFPSEIYPSFESLSNGATINELIEITNHPNPISRYYAFQALIEHNVEADIIFDIVKTHLKDTCTVKTQFGCIGSRTSIGDFMLSSIKYTRTYKLDELRKNEIDSLLFWNDQNLILARNEVFDRIEKNPENYSRLKTILINERNPLALLPLLSYGDSEDRLLIADFISISPFHAFKAIRLFPKIELVEKLKEFQNNDPHDFSNQTWIALYDAALSYPEQTALDLYLSIFNKLDKSEFKERHAQFIYWSIKDNDSEFLFPVKIEIARYLSNMTVEYFDDIWINDSILAFEIITERFKTESHPFWDEELINEIVDKVENVLSDSAIIFINHGIEKGYSTTYYTLALRAKKYHNPDTEEILIRRFNSESGNDEQDIYYRSKGILNYDSEVVYRKIEDKVFEFIEHREIGAFAGKNIVDLVILSNKEKGVATLLKLIEENQKSFELLRISVSKLIELNDVSINSKLVEIYDKSPNHYKISHFGQTFKKIIDSNNLR